jgi:hypothetical protein
MFGVYCCNLYALKISVKDLRLTLFENVNKMERNKIENILLVSMVSPKPLNLVLLFRQICNVSKIQGKFKIFTPLMCGFEDTWVFCNA